MRDFFGKDCYTTVFYYQSKSKQEGTNSKDDGYSGMKEENRVKIPSPFLALFFIFHIDLVSRRSFCFKYRLWLHQHSPQRFQELLVKVNAKD